VRKQNAESNPRKENARFVWNFANQPLYDLVFLFCAQNSLPYIRRWPLRAGLSVCFLLPTDMPYDAEEK
jgi:hypothetical protein